MTIFGICTFGRCHLFLFLMNFMTGFYLRGACAAFGSLLLGFFFCLNVSINIHNWTEFELCKLLRTDNTSEVEVTEKVAVG